MAVRVFQVSGAICTIGLPTTTARPQPLRSETSQQIDSVDIPARPQAPRRRRVGLAPGVRVGTPSESWSWKARPGAAFLRRDGRQDPVVLLPVALWVRLLCRWLAALTAVGAHHVRNGFY